MKDRLKDYIAEHREAFDTESPSEGLWDKIASDLEQNASVKKKQAFFRPWMGVAASILLAAMAYWAGTLQGGDQSTSPPLADKGSYQPGSQPADEFAQAVHYYQEVISERKATVKNTAESDSLQKTMLSDLLELDRQFQQLKEQQKKLPSEKITSAMILNLQMQLRVLNRQLEFLNQQKEVKNEPDVIQI